MQTYVRVVRKQEQSNIDIDEERIRVCHIHLVSFGSVALEFESVEGSTSVYQYEPTIFGGKPTNQRTFEHAVTTPAPHPIMIQTCIRHHSPWIIIRSVDK